MYYIFVKVQQLFPVFILTFLVLCLCKIFISFVSRINIVTNNSTVVLIIQFCIPSAHISNVIHTIKLPTKGDILSKYISMYNFSQTKFENATNICFGMNTYTCGVNTIGNKYRGVTYLPSPCMYRYLRLLRSTERISLQGRGVMNCY